MSVRVYVESDINSGSIDFTIYADDGSTTNSETFTLTDGPTHRLDSSIDGTDHWFESNISGDAEIKNVLVDPNPNTGDLSKVTIKGNFSNQSILRPKSDGETRAYISGDSSKETFEIPNIVIDDTNKMSFEANLAPGDNIESVDIVVGTVTVTAGSVKTSSVGNPISGQGLRSLTSIASKTLSSSRTFASSSSLTASSSITRSDSSKELTSTTILFSKDGTIQTASGKGLQSKSADIHKATGSGITATKGNAATSDLEIAGADVNTTIFDGDLSITFQQGSSEYTAKDFDTGFKEKSFILNGISPNFSVSFNAQLSGDAKLNKVDVYKSGTYNNLKVDGIPKVPRPKITALPKYGTTPSYRKIRLDAVTTKIDVVARQGRFQKYPRARTFPFQATRVIPTSVKRANGIPLTPDVESTAFVDEQIASGNPKTLKPQQIDYSFVPGEIVKANRRYSTKFESISETIDGSITKANYIGFDFTTGSIKSSSVSTFTPTTSIKTYTNIKQDIFSKELKESLTTEITNTPSITNATSKQNTVNPIDIALLNNLTKSSVTTNDLIGSYGVIRPGSIVDVDSTTLKSAPGGILNVDGNKLKTLAKLFTGKRVFPGIPQKGNINTFSSALGIRQVLDDTKVASANPLIPQFPSLTTQIDTQISSGIGNIPILKFFVSLDSTEQSVGIQKIPNIDLTTILDFKTEASSKQLTPNTKIISNVQKTKSLSKELEALYLPDVSKQVANAYPISVFGPRFVTPTKADGIPNLGIGNQTITAPGLNTKITSSTSKITTSLFTDPVIKQENSIQSIPTVTLTSQINTELHNGIPSIPNTLLDTLVQTYNSNAIPNITKEDIVEVIQKTSSNATTKQGKLVAIGNIQNASASPITTKSLGVSISTPTQSQGIPLIPDTDVAIPGFKQTATVTQNVITTNLDVVGSLNRSGSSIKIPQISLTSDGKVVKSVGDEITDKSFSFILNTDITLANGIQATDDKWYGYGLKTLATGDARVPTPLSIVNPQTSNGIGLTPKVSLTVGGKIQKSDRNKIDINTKITTIGSILDSSGIPQSSSIISTAISETTNISSIGIPKFDSTEIVASLLKPKALSVELEAVYAARGLKTKAVGKGKVLGLSFVDPRQSNGIPIDSPLLSITTDDSVRKSTGSGIPTKESIVHVQKSTELSTADDTSTLSNELVVNSSITSGFGNISSPEFGTITTQNIIQSALFSPTEATKLVVEEANGIPLEATKLVIQESNGIPINAYSSEIVTDIDTKLSQDNPLVAGLGGDVKVQSSVELSNVDTFQQYPVKVTTDNIVKTSSSVELVTGLDNVTTQNIIHKSIFNPNESVYSSQGSKSDSVGIPKTGIYQKAEIKSASSKQLTPNSKLTTKSLDKTDISSSPVTSTIGGDVIVDIDAHTVLDIPIQAEFSNVYRKSYEVVKSIDDSRALVPRARVTSFGIVHTESSFGVVPNTLFDVELETQKSIGRGLQNIQVGFPAKATGRPLESIPVADKQRSNVTTFETSTERIRVTTPPQLSTVNGLIPLSFPHVPALQKQKGNVRILDASLYIEQISQPSNPQIEANPIKAYEQKHVSFTSPNKFNALTIAGSISLIKRASFSPITTNVNTKRVTILRTDWSPLTAGLPTVEETANVNVQVAESTFPMDKTVTLGSISDTSYNCTINKKSKQRDPYIPQVSYNVECNPREIQKSEPEPVIWTNKPIVESISNDLVSMRQELNKWKKKAYLGVSSQQSLENAIDKLQSKYDSLSDKNRSLIPSQRPITTPEKSLHPDQPSAGDETKYTISQTTATDLVVDTNNVTKAKANARSFYISKSEVSTTKANVSSLNGVQKTGFINQANATPLFKNMYNVKALCIIGEELRQKAKVSTVLESPLAPILTEVNGYGSITKGNVITFLGPKRDIKTDAHSRQRIPSVSFNHKNRSSAEITTAEAFFSTRGNISDLDQSKLTSKTYINYSDVEREYGGYHRPDDVIFTVAVEGRTNDIAKTAKVCIGDGGYDSDGCPTANPGAKDGWDAGLLGTGIYEIFPVAGEHQMTFEDYGRTNQPFDEEILWGALGLGFGNHNINISIDSSTGIDILDRPELSKYGGIVIEVGRQANPTGNISVDDDVLQINEIVSRDKNTYKVYDDTHLTPFASSDAEITKAETKSLTDFQSWVLNYGLEDKLVIEPISVESTWKTLELEFDATIEEFEKILQPLRQYAGKTKTFEMADGGFRSVDLSNENNTINVAPKSSLFPLRRRQEMLVEQISGSPRNNKWNDIKVKLKLRRKQEIEGRKNSRFSGITETGTSWEFNFHKNTIKTNNVDAKITRRASKGVKEFSITMRTNKAQTKVVEESANKQNKVLIENWSHDKERKVKDLSENNNNTVEITPPKQTNILNEGKYIIKNWRVEWISDEFYETELKLIPKNV